MNWIYTYKAQILQKLPQFDSNYDEIEKKIQKADCPRCVKTRYELKLKRQVSQSMKPGMFPPQLEQLLAAYNPSYGQKNKIKTVSLKPEEISILDERKGCIDCVRKHMSQAIILLRECNQGYGTDEFEHKWLAVGHLAEAADEALQINPALSMKIRDLRLMIMEQE
jgi:hypothetical protein